MHDIRVETFHIALHNWIVRYLDTDKRDDENWPKVTPQMSDFHLFNYYICKYITGSTPECITFLASRAQGT